MEQADHPLGHGAGVAEGDEHAPVLVEQLLRMPVGGGDDRLAAAEGVGERARGRLGGVKIGGDIDVADAEEDLQLLLVDEAVVEADVPPDAEILRQPLEAEPVGLAVFPHQVRVGRAEDDVDQVGKFFDDGRDGAQHRLDPLVGREEPEGEEHVLALDAELVLIKTRIDEGDVGDAVGDEVDLLVGHAVDFPQHPAPPARS